MFMQNWPKNYFRTLCWNWCHWKWTDCRPAGTCTSEWWPLKEQIIPTSEGMMRWSMMEKQDGVSSWWLLTFKYTLCTTGLTAIFSPLSLSQWFLWGTAFLIKGYKYKIHFKNWYKKCYFQLLNTRGWSEAIKTFLFQFTSMVCSWLYQTGH